MCYAAEAHMLQAAVFGAFHPARNAVTGTIGVVAKKGAATYNAFGCKGLIGVMAFGGTFWIAQTIGLEVIGIVIIVCAPFPDIPRHVVKTISIGGKGCYRSRMIIVIRFGVLVGEMAIPEIAFGLPGIYSLIAPGIDVVP